MCSLAILITEDNDVLKVNNGFISGLYSLEFRLFVTF